MKSKKEKAHAKAKAEKKARKHIKAVAEILGIAAQLQMFFKKAIRELEAELGADETDLYMQDLDKTDAETLVKEFHIDSISDN